MYPDEELLALSGIQHFSFCRRQWAPIPIEYKRGAAKGSPCDRLQVCAQAMCLEEMLGCDISSGFLFYKQTQSRELVDLDDELRCEVRESAAEMHQLFKRGSIPKARKGKACRACSLIDECLPALQPRSALSYINSTLGECDASSSTKNTNGSGAS